jgi:benzoate transport
MRGSFADWDSTLNIGSRSKPPLDWFPIGLCVAISVLDGYDLLIISFGAPSIASEWQLSPRSIGLLFSAGLVGMGLGGVTLAPLADIVGRRRIILCCLVCATLGMILGAASESFAQLVLFRFLTGFGVGAMMPAINTAVAEYAGARIRNVAIPLQAAGYPIGGALSGLAAIPLLSAYGWRSLLLVGGCLSLLLLVGAFWRLPESAAFMMNHAPDNAPVRANAILRKSDAYCLSALLQSCSMQARIRIHALFASELIRATAWICVATFLVQFAFYFLVNWAPTLLSRAHAGTRVGIAGAVVLNCGGIVGDVLFGITYLRFSPHRIGALAMISCVLCIVLLAYATQSTCALLVMATLTGCFLFASMASLYTVAPALFPSFVRSTGTGLALSVGRIGGAIGPTVAALVLGRSLLPTPHTLAILALPLLSSAAILVFGLGDHFGRAETHSDVCSSHKDNSLALSQDAANSLPSLIGGPQ